METAAHDDIDDALIVFYFKAHPLNRVGLSCIAKHIRNENGSP